MKKYDYKRVLKNILTLFMTFFILWLLLSLYCDWSVLNSYSLFWDIKTSLLFSAMAGIVYVPFLVLAGFIKMNEKTKLTLAFILSVVTTIIYIIKNLSYNIQ